jgi:hypothetical protein
MHFISYCEVTSPPGDENRDAVVLTYELTPVNLSLTIWNWIGEDKEVFEDFMLWCVCIGG